ncbi:MAG: 2-succinyl-5-enolpyruvyl-6-hydroxy-3-cyclohexene-1-carboxylic-acid synthase [Sphaerobacter thermophilus]|uniref:2-succinyl-5-enolpyruvyl-6-hydroxy-3- cyclohexene-1-carboxylic-acid synthase n=1 Tax=Sphaerobacter thermophilus TaxID=2057 RepID=UPI000DAFDAF1|nr:MAG: 2-succinyl-5-enolpyruvyl-6-hydroxy-3-cyclohexene-1-carboxylic-acid synthase [Sphaerobacter thermophilus]
MTHEQVLFTYVGAFVDELARAGVRHVVFAPGSRSTPLAVMLARHPDIRLWLHLDERSAAFFALGMAKARREPVAVVCSSGTAAANFLPAVVEARYARVPLLLLTADRPHELRDVGAPQAIDQIHLFGSNVKWFVDAAPPEATPGMLRYARMLAARAAATALADPAGPVHLNFPFREPLMPLSPEEDAPAEGVATGITVSRAPRVPDPATVQALAKELAAARRGLIVCGPQTDPDLGPAVVGLARALGFPVLADPLSHVRCGPHVDDVVLDAYDAFLRDPALVERLAPDLVLRFGAMPTSKPVLLYLQRHPAARHIVVDGGDGWEDPALLAAEVVHASPTHLCSALTDLPLSQHWERGAGGEGRPTWLTTWQQADRAARGAIAQRLAGMDELFEGKVFAELAALLPEGSTLFAGNSMPVRDLDTFFPRSQRAIRFLANRGANGIDGVISSALGAAAASDGPLVLAIGDISFYHDMNGLLAAKLHDLSATIVLFNNDGGGIFSFLPQAAYPEHFEALFGTPHGLDFRPVADLYGAAYTRIATWDAFREAVAQGVAASGLSIVEVPTDRERNVALHREMWRAVSAALAGEVPAWA